MRTAASRSDLLNMPLFAPLSSATRAAAARRQLLRPPPLPPLPPLLPLPPTIGSVYVASAGCIEQELSRSASRELIACAEDRAE